MTPAKPVTIKGPVVVTADLLHPEAANVTKPVERLGTVTTTTETIRPLPPAPRTTDINTAPTTTAAQDLVSEGQRHINLMWERTQQIIAISVTIFTLVMCGVLIWRGQESTAVPAFLLLSNVCVLVMGTYFQRTNHVKTGGVGANDTGR